MQYNIYAVTRRNKTRWYYRVLSHVSKAYATREAATLAANIDKEQSMKRIY